jgi:hypothetical protein
MYWKFLKQTPWRGYVPPDRTLANVARRHLRDMLPDWLVRAVRHELTAPRLPAQLRAVGKKPKLSGSLACGHVWLPRSSAFRSVRASRSSLFGSFPASGSREP